MDETTLAQQDGTVQVFANARGEPYLHSCFGYFRCNSDLIRG